MSADLLIVGFGLVTLAAIVALFALPMWWEHRERMARIRCGGE